jgi:hypothetical protein
MNKNYFLLSSLYSLEFACVYLISTLIPLESALALPTESYDDQFSLTELNQKQNTPEKIKKQIEFVAHTNVQNLLIRNLDIPIPSPAHNIFPIPETIEYFQANANDNGTDHPSITLAKLGASTDITHDLVAANVSTLNTDTTEYVTLDFFGDELMAIAIPAQTVPQLKLAPDQPHQRIVMDTTSAHDLVHQVVNRGSSLPANYAYAREDGAIVLSHIELSSNNNYVNEQKDKPITADPAVTNETTKLIAITPAIREFDNLNHHDQPHHPSTFTLKLFKPSFSYFAQSHNTDHIQNNPTDSELISLANESKTTLTIEKNPEPQDINLQETEVIFNDLQTSNYDVVNNHHQAITFTEITTEITPSQVKEQNQQQNLVWLNI